MRLDEGSSPLGRRASFRRQFIGYLPPRCVQMSRRGQVRVVSVTSHFISPAFTFRTSLFPVVPGLAGHRQQAAPKAADSTNCRTDNGRHASIHDNGLERKWEAERQSALAG